MSPPAVLLFLFPIIGGAIAPPSMGYRANHYHSMAICLIRPLTGFLATTVYGFVCPRWLEGTGRAVA